MNEIPWGLLPIIFAVFAVLTIVVMERRPSAGRLLQAHLQKEEVVRYCGACGARAIVFRYQYGFQEKTGLPNYHSFLGCPDWDMNTGRASAMIFSTGVQDVAECTARSVHPMTPVYTHQGHDVSEPSTDCVRCIIDMERAGIIDHDGATKRLKEIA